MSRFARMLGGLLVLVVLLAPRPAHAEATLRDYVMRIEVPSRSDEPALFNVTLAYAWPSDETKTSGFKFVGKQDVSDLSAWDESGRALAVSAEREVRSREVQLTFAVPASGVVNLQFRQPLAASTYAWDSATAAIPWAHVFRIPVQHMRVEVRGPAGYSVSGYECGPELGRTLCVRDTTGAERVVVPTSPGRQTPAQGIAVLGVVLVAALALRALQRRYRELVATRGVLPPASPAAYPDLSEAYRAPPPLPQPSSAEPVLPPEERHAFFKRAATGVGVWLLAVLAVAVFGNGISPLPMPITVILFAGAAMALLWAYLAKDEGRGWSPAAVGVAAIGLAVGGGFAWMLAGLTPLMIAGFMNMPAGSGGGGSSSSGWTSCGGGGGGCGGGGGGCGGGGGGCGG